MLNRLIEYGIDNEFFKFDELGKLDKSCCTISKIRVIDFDDTKTKISIISNLQDPKSADALKIIPHINRIDFIELKGFSEFIKHNKSRADISEKLEEQIKKFNLNKKIKDSLSLLWLVINQNEFRCNKQEAKQYETVEKNYFVVTDIEQSKDPIKDRLHTLIFLSLKRDVKNIPASPFDNLNEPKLLRCSQIDTYYQKLLNEKSEGVQ